MRKQLLQSALAKTRETPPLPFQTTFISPDSWPFPNDGSGSTRSIAATKSPIRIAVLDSSFNPPTRAHYQLLKAAASVGCDAVLLLLATNNADKGQMGAGAVERLEMMEAMAEHSIEHENHHPALRQMAIGLTTHARFMDKAQPILDHFKSCQIQLSWILGHDTMIRLFDPKYYQDVHTDLAPFFEKCDVICSSRPGFGSREEMMQFVEQSGHGKKVTLVDIVDDDDGDDGEGVESKEVPVNELSSTLIRDAIKNKNWSLVDQSVLPSVRRVIEENNLYSLSSL